MAKTIEELRKIINEEETDLLIKAQLRLSLTIKEREAFEKLKVRLADEEGLDEIPSVDLLQKMYKKLNKSFELQSASDLIKTQIFENFAKEFGKDNIRNNLLYFPDETKVDDFFRRQAQEGHSFLFREVNCDNYVFSDGKGCYKMGSKAEISSYCRQNSLVSPFETEAASEEQVNREPSMHP